MLYAKNRSAALWRRMWKQRMFYALAVPGLLYFLIFHYFPMYGIVIAFKDYNIYKGIWGSEWVGFSVFRRLFGLANFSRAFWNTVIICIEKMVTGFPLSILLALMLNELRSQAYNKYVSTALILPHFISWVVIYGLVYAILSPNIGVISNLWKRLFPDQQVPNLLINPNGFRPLMVFLHSWRNVGFASIMYTAAIAGIDPQLYESAQIDGAGRWKQMTNVTLPCIMPTIITMWILRLGDLLGADFDQILTFMNSAVIRKGDIIDTFVYRMGLQEAEYSLSTAAGLFKSVFSLVFVLGTNSIVKRYDRDSALM